ncbi:hypothetical protein MASR1M74_31490 [Lentimicrobium sp.]
MKTNFTLKHAPVYGLLILVMVLGFHRQAVAQEIVKQDAGDTFIRLDLMEHTYFVRLMVMDGIYDLKSTKVDTPEGGVLYIYPPSEEIMSCQAKIRSLIEGAAAIEARSDKFEQSEIMNNISTARGEWIMNYAISGQRDTENDSCHKSMPFCTGTIYSFPAGVNTGNAQSGPNYGCLSSRPNPVWYHMKILTPGNITIRMQGTRTSGGSLDIDFALWGPFENPVTPCTALLTANCSSCPNNTTNPNFYPSGNLHDCSYSSAGIENAHIVNGQTGQYFIMLITNYANAPGNITFEKTAGNGTTDCTILPPPATSNSPVCVGETIQLSAANAPGASYQWSGPSGFMSHQQNPQIPNAQFNNAGIYSLVITVGNQTSDPTSTEVFVYNPPTATISGTTSICIGDSTKLTINATGVGPFRATYAAGSGLPVVVNFWQSPHSFWVKPTTTTTYTLTSIMNNACAGTVTGSSTVTVKQRPAPAFSTQNDCSRQQTIFTDETTIPIGGIASWEWNFGDGGTSNQQNPVHTYANSGTFNVQLNVTGNNGCGGTSIISPLVIKPTPVVNAGPDKTIAYGTTTTLDGTTSGGTGAFTYRWEPADKVANPNILTPVTVQLAATTDFTLTSTDSGNGCKESDQMKVNITGGPLAAIIQSDKPDICIGESTLLNAQVSGGSSNYSYSWTSQPAGFTSTNEDVTVNPVVTTTYHLSVNDGFNTINAQFQVVVNPSPQPDAGAAQTIAHGTTAMLSSTVSSGTPPYLYAWSPADMLVEPTKAATPTKNLYATQDFTLQVTDNKGCKATGTTRVNIEGGPLQANPVAAKPAICLYESTTIKALPSGGSNQYTYQWVSDPPGFTSTEAEPVVSPVQTTTYTVNISDGFNSTNGSVIVAVNPLPQINLIPDNPKVQVISNTEIGICVYDTITIDAGNPGAQYQWSNGSSTQTINILTSGISFDLQHYSVTVTDPETQCSNEAHIDAFFTFQNCSYGLSEQESDPRMIIYPNPSADGLFNLKINELQGVSILEVYNLQLQVLIRRSLDLGYGSNYQGEINMQGKPAGIYFLKLTNPKGLIVKKLIINK